MNFTILINTTQPSAHVAYQFCKTLLEKNHKIVRIFFYQDGVNHANRLTTHNAWQIFAQQHAIELTLCVTSATRRGITTENLISGFKIAGLGQLIEAIIHSDRFMSFG